MIQQTSLLAYLGEVRPKLNNSQQMVLEVLEQIYPANNKQIARHIGWSINSVTPRVLELRKAGRVQVVKIDKDESGRSSMFYAPIKEVEYDDTH